MQKKHAKQLKKKKKGFWDAVGDLNPVKHIMGAIESNNDTDVTSVQNINFDVSNKQITDQVAKCVNIASSSSLQTMDNSKCVEKILDTCAKADFKTDKAKNDCIKGASSMEYSNVAQTSEIDHKQMCQVHAVIDVLAKSKASIDNAAITDILQEATGPLTGNKFKSSTCQNVNGTMKGCQYIQNSACCANESIIDTKQQFELCGKVDGSTQKINSSSQQKCLLNADSIIKAEMDADIHNSNETKARQKAVLSGCGCILVMLCLFCFVCVLMFPEMLPF